MQHIYSFFDLDPSLEIDKEQLRKAFIAKQREWHPDRAIRKGITPEKAIFETAKINDAYRILSEESLHIKYLLEVFDQKDYTKEWSIDQVFLMEMMEINEDLEEAILSEKDLESFLSKVEIMEMEVRENLNNGLRTNNPLEFEEQDWRVLADFYAKLKYFLRIKEKINTFATR